ncbi:MAG: S8 family peptidase [Bdellovibrionota bacterium]
MKKTFLLALFVLLFASCSSDEKLVTNSLPNIGVNPNRLPPGKYTQSALEIPATVNDTYYLAAAPWANSSLVPYLWGFSDLEVVSRFPNLTLPAAEIVVAVIDTGVDKDHEDLAGRLWVNPREGSDALYNNFVDDDSDGFRDNFLGWDFVNNTNNPADDAGHGTHVAGTIAAIGNNSLGIVGVSPWVRIMAIKVCNESGSCRSSDIRAAISFAASHGAKIINLSLGGLSRGSDAIAFDQVITEATNAGVLVVAAAGNSTADTALMTPANATHSIAVAAHANDGGICSFSNWGWKVDFSAPGCAVNEGREVAGVLSLNSRKCGQNADQYCSLRNLVGNAYTLKSGTSMATPHVAGLAAVAFTASPTATPLQIRQALLRTSRAVSTGYKHVDFGAGKASSINLIDEARTAPGIKITSPFYGTSAESHAIGIRIEARDQPVEWTLKYKRSSDGENLDVSDATTIENGSAVLPSNAINHTVNWTPPASGDYIIVLEGRIGAELYYDTHMVNRP